MLEYKEITKGTRRYDVDDDEVLNKVRSFFEDVLYDFENKSFTHYKIPHKFQKTSKRVRSDGKRQILVLLGGTVETKQVADEARHLMEVPYAGAFEWHYFFEQSTKTLFKKKWNIFPKLQRATLEYVVEHCPDYVAPELILWLEANPIEVVRERKGPRLDLEIAIQERDEKKKKSRKRKAR